MKLDPLFTVKNKQLYKIQDDSLVDLSSIQKMELSWKTIELEEESYNEEFLAQLRDQLKILDEQNKFVVLIPVVDKKLETPEDFELFTNAFNHTARRIKDCISVLGYELPSELVAKGIDEGSPVQEFIEVLAKKHAQYVYFIKTADSEAFSGSEALNQFVIC